MTIDLSDKIALVTGGSGDIGGAMCRRLAQAGADVAFTWFSDHDAAEATEKAITEAGRTAFSFRANFGSPEETPTLVEALREKLERVDVLVSNAASGVLRPALELKAKHWQWTMDINARVLLDLTQGLLADPALMGEGGRIFAVSSAGAVRAVENYAAIGASKAALESTARHLAMELGPKGINVNVLSPGVVDTKALQHFPNREQLIKVAQMRTPMGRIVTPDDVADVLLLLCSEQSRMIQGQTLVVDGGYSILA